ncbi:MAG: peptidase propeptide [Verrucomicrobia bacterium]|nr:peptidase propeptide [Verrucomicrobiota bacterium]
MLQTFRLALKLRHFAELESRIARGEVLTVEEMTARHFPTSADWSTVAAWATQRGLTVTPADCTRLSVQVSGSTAQFERAFEKSFARSAYETGTPAPAESSLPEIPAELSSLVLGVLPIEAAETEHPAQMTTVPTISNRLHPLAVRDFYHVTGLGLDGEGETIVILGGSTMNVPDTGIFWSQTGLPTTTAQVETFFVPPFYSTYGSEYTLDTEWSLAMAPKARVIYINTYALYLSVPLILERLRTDSSLHQLSYSSATAETSFFRSNFAQDGNQYYAVLTGLGISCFASTGDFGSRQDIGAYAIGSYEPNSPRTAAIPCSSPYVTAVGGTTLGYTPGLNGTYTLPVRETAWTLPEPAIIPPADPSTPARPPNYGQPASSGGYSVVFARPAWQQRPDLPGGIGRMVPDVSAMANGNPLPYAYYTGGGILLNNFGGTSMSCPLWAGFCALANQARRKAGLPPLGLVGPRLYPLLHSAVFNEMPAGSSDGIAVSTTAGNGDYKVGSGYTLVTGLGSPNVDQLIKFLTSDVAITTQPVSQTLSANTSATFSVTATTTGGTLSYQWLFDGKPLSGATASTYTFSATPASSGAHSVTVTNQLATRTSDAVLLTVTAPGQPVITRPPLSYNATFGGTSVLRVETAASSSPQSFQWYFQGYPLTDGEGIAGTSTSTLRFTNSTPGCNGKYLCLVENAAGSVLAEGTMNVPYARNTEVGRLINLSCRARAGADQEALIAGFVVGGAGTTGTQNLLIRASGPALVPYGVGGTLTDPLLKLYDTKNESVFLASNDRWAGDAMIANTASRVGAFPWPEANSRDCALIRTAAGGPYGAVIASASGTPGVALAEIYDSTVAGTYLFTSPRLVNLSARTRAGMGENALIAGFVIGGTTAKTVLVRASGPALLPFGVTETLADPQLELFSAGDGATPIATNRGWAGSAAVREAASAVGAFTWTNNASLDSALVITLPPGSYSAKVTGASGASGIALVEIYDVP